MYTDKAAPWKVSNTNFPNNYNIELTLNNCASPASVSVSDLRLLVDDDGNFSNATVYNTGGGFSISYSNGIVTLSGISNTQIPINSTKYITIGSINWQTSLPVSLVSFKAECENNQTNLSWSTATEINNDFFTIERSTDGIEFYTIATVDGSGNSTTIKNYSWIDNDPIMGTNYYRLKQTDFNGEFEYFEIRSTNCSVDHQVNIYPNPFNNYIEVVFEKLLEKDYQIVIKNYLGQTILNKTVSRKSTKIRLELDSKLSKGTYFLQMFNNNEIKFTKKIIRL